MGPWRHGRRRDDCGGMSMRISELIQKLEGMQRVYGDLRVTHITTLRPIDGDDVFETTTDDARVIDKADDPIGKRLRLVP